MKDMKIIACSGSNSSTSINSRLVAYATRNLHNVEVVTLTDYEVPIYGEDIERHDGIPQAVKALDEVLSRAGALVLSVAEHNGNVSAFLKNLLDWLSRNNRNFLTDKKVVLLSTSPGAGGASAALEIANKTLPYFGAQVVATLSIGKFYDVFKDGKIVDEQIEKQLHDTLSVLQREGE